MYSNIKRIYTQYSLNSDNHITLTSSQIHYLKNVLRIKVNDRINIFEGKSGEWETVVISVNRDNTVLRVIKNLIKMKESKDIWLIFAPIKQIRMNITIQKATELGVAKIFPCITDFTNIRNINIKNLQDNAIEAAEQSERLDIPKIEKVTDLALLLSEWPKDRKLVFCDERINSEKLITKKIFSISRNYKKWAVIVGPEGGFSDSERTEILKIDNVINVSLGEELLRSDTATIVSLFCIQQFLS